MDRREAGVVEQGATLTLFENLQTQRESGRVTPQAADDLARLIGERLPVNALVPRNRRARSQVLLESRVAGELAGLAADLRLKGLLPCHVKEGTEEEIRVG